MRHKFPKIKQTESERIWLAEVCRRYRNKEDLDIKVIKVALREKLPRDFNPYAYDGRLYSGTRPTLLGIWHVDPESDLLDKTDRVIRAIQKIIFDNAKVQEVSSFDIKVDGIPEDQVPDIFRLVVGLCRSYVNVNDTIGKDGRKECKLSIGDAFEDFYVYSGLDTFVRAFCDRYESSMRSARTSSINPGLNEKGDLSPSVFVVHGHDDGAKNSVARFLEKLGLAPVILHEKPDGGQTIIEKFEHYSNVGFAVVLMSPDDVGAPATKKDNLCPRARQNVILELGFFVGKLGRKRVCALYVEGVEMPSDYNGVLYIPIDRGDFWKMKLARELKNAGLPIDLNDAM